MEKISLRGAIHLLTIYTDSPLAVMQAVAWTVHSSESGPITRLISRQIGFPPCYAELKPINEQLEDWYIATGQTPDPDEAIAESEYEEYERSLAEERLYTEQC